MADLVQLHHAFDAVLATRYLEVVGLTCVVYNLFLTLDQDFMFFRKQPSGLTLLKLSYIFHRYFVLMALLYAAYVLSDLHPSLSELECKVYCVVLGVCLLMASALSEYCILYKVLQLWDYHPVVRLALTLGYLISYSGILISVVFTQREVYTQVRYDALVNTCAIDTKPVAMIASWGGTVFFDLYTIILTFWNSMHRPHRSDRMQAELIANLRNDGLSLFITLIAIHLLTLIFCVLATVEQLFIIAFFDWAIVSIVICHLLVRLGTIDVQVDPDWGISKHISTTPWTEFAMKVSNRRSDSLIT